MGDPQNNICMVIGNPSGLFQRYSTLRCFKVPDNVPPYTFVSPYDPGSSFVAPFLDLFTPTCEFKLGTTQITLQSESVLFSKTFFK